jgi:AbiJ N-terminal domain 4
MNRWVPPSKRQARAEAAGKPVVYQYDSVPDALRRQIVMIFQRAIGERLYSHHSYVMGEQTTQAHVYWMFIFKKLRDERGDFRLATGTEPNEQVLNFLLNCDRDGFIDAVELCLRVIHVLARDADPALLADSGVTESADDAIANVNYRFQEHRFGYSFVPDARELVRIDSQYLHANVVEESFKLLQRGGFAGAENEFQEAHREYRGGHYKDAITKALNAVESTIKTICLRRNWVVSSKAASKDLIKVIFDNELIARSHETFFGAMRAVLESGLPTVRNQSTASHGQGADVVVVPPHVAAFALHLAASSIVLLVEADKGKK